MTRHEFAQKCLKYNMPHYKRYSRISFETNWEIKRDTNCIKKILYIRESLTKCIITTSGSCDSLNRSHWPPFHSSDLHYLYILFLYFPYWLYFISFAVFNYTSSSLSRFELTLSLSVWLLSQYNCTGVSVK